VHIKNIFNFLCCINIVIVTVILDKIVWLQTRCLKIEVSKHERNCVCVCLLFSTIKISLPVDAGCGQHW